MNWLEILGEVEPNVAYQWRKSDIYIRTNKTKY